MIIHNVSSKKSSTDDKQTNILQKGLAGRSKKAYFCIHSQPKDHIYDK